MNTLTTEEEINVPGGKTCPICGLETVQEVVLGYEKELFCTNCDYTNTVTIK